MELAYIFLGLGATVVGFVSWFLITTIPAWQKEIVDGTPALLIVPTIVFLIFMAVGIFFIVISLKAILANRNVDRKGTLAYGRVFDVRYNGRLVNHRPQYDAMVLLNIDGGPKLLAADIGSDKNAYTKGMYVITKYYDDMITIVEAVPDYSDGLRDFKNWAENLDEQIEAKKQSDTAPIGPITELELKFFNKHIKKYWKSGIKFFGLLWLPFMAIFSYFVFPAVKTGEVGIIEAAITACFDLFGIFAFIKSIVGSIFANAKRFEFTRGRVTERKDIVLKNAASYVSIDIKLNDGRVLEKILMPRRAWVNVEYVVVATGKRTKEHYLFNAKKKYFAQFSAKSANLALKLNIDR